MRLVQPMGSMWTGSSKRVSVVIPTYVGIRELGTRMFLEVTHPGLSL